MKVPKLKPLRKPGQKGRLTGLQSDIRQLWYLALWLQNDFLSGKYAGDPLKVGCTLPRHCGATRSLSRDLGAIIRTIKLLQRTKGR